MDLITAGLINTPIMILSILVNAFFMFCLVCPPQGQQIKQPLKLLLGTLVCSTITCLMTYLLQYLYMIMITDYTVLMLISHPVWIFTFSTSMSSSAWLNFFFYAQIVPAQRDIFMWIKKNIKAVIYCIWLWDKILSLFDVCTELLGGPVSHVIFGGVSYNVTIYNNTTYLQMDSLRKIAFDITISFSRAILFLRLCVMVLSSSSTVFYLCKHIRRMVANGQPLSCSHLRNQVRVTITGILQGLLYLFCVTWIMYINVSWQHALSDLTFSYPIVINVYMLGTTFNLGAGQRVFRERAAEIWQRAVQWLKGPDVQQPEEAG